MGGDWSEITGGQGCRAAQGISRGGRRGAEPRRGPASGTSARDRTTPLSHTPPLRCRWSASAGRRAAFRRCRRSSARCRPTRAWPSSSSCICRPSTRARWPKSCSDRPRCRWCRCTTTSAGRSRTASTSSRRARRSRRSNGHLTAARPLNTRARQRVAVDLFFRTLADTHGPHAAAIVLSGADGDGAIGIKRIKERGGLTIAQDPDEAEHREHAAPAIATGMVDWVLPVARDAGAAGLVYARLDARLKLPPEDGPQPARAVTAPTATRKRRCARCSPSCARAPGATSRTTSARPSCAASRRRMQVNGVTDLPAYLAFLRTHPGEAGALLQDLLISVTNFFRDRDAFDALEAQLPRLFDGKRPNDTVRVWVPACATGEEAYSIAMLLCEHARMLEAPPTHADLRDRPRRGRDPRSRAKASIRTTIAADVSEDRLQPLLHQGAPRLPGAPRSARDGALRAARPAEGLAVLAPRPRLAAATC